MGEDPGTIRREIEQTREQMGTTVEALGYKADVPGRAKEAVTGRFSRAKDAIAGTAGSVSDATPDGQQIKQGAQQAVGVAQSNPLGLAIGAAAIGFLAGMLIPETQIEHEKLGQVSDQVKDTVRDTAQEAVQHGKDAAQEVAQQTVATAKDTAQQAAQEHGQQVKETAQANVQETAQQVSG